MHKISNKAILALLLAAIGLFHLLTIRYGHSWGDDFALYVHHAKLIAEGRNYEATGYVYNPAVPAYGPRYYPPFYPLLLSLAYKAGGGSFTIMKLEQVIILVLALLAIALCFRRALTPLALFVAIAVIGFNPEVWELKDSLTSDLTFLALLFFTGALADHIARRYGHGSFPWREQLFAGTGLGGLFYLGCATRSVGLALIPAALLYACARWRRLPIWIMSATGVCGIGLVIQHAILGPNSYSDQLHVTFAWLRFNAIEYLRAAQLPWDNGYIRGLRWALYAAHCSVAIAAVLLKLRRRRSSWTFIDCFAPVYIGVILVWPGNQGFRFLLPLFPLAVVYFMSSDRILRLLKFSRPRRRAVIAAAALVFAFCYAAKYTKVQKGVIPESYGLASFRDLCSQIAQKTGEHDLILFTKARTISLFTDRPAAAYQPAANPEQVWDFMKAKDVKYCVVSRLFDEDHRVLVPLLSEKQGKFVNLYANADFTLYRVVQ